MGHPGFNWAEEQLGEVCKQRDRAQREVERLRGVLCMIEGGDAPCKDESLLRRWAYEALTLGRDAASMTMTDAT